MAPLRLVADLHLHSRYSLATSRSLDLLTLADAGRAKGIDLLAAPDFTHPAWLAEMRAELVECDEGVYAAHGGKFMLATEVSCIWRHDGKSRRVHLLVWAPDFSAVDQISSRLAKVQNLSSDGRPMLKLSAREMAGIAWDADERCVIIPAHVWTPWYGMYGSKSGFDSVEECFGDAAYRIHAIETGLSSDPAMNWMVPDVDSRSVVSFSDAHSAGNMGRELTVFRAEPNFTSLASALQNQHIVETFEFHPGHGKYHLDGHRKCGVRLEPGGGGEQASICPVCDKPLTLGVLNRVTELAARPGVAEPSGDGLVKGPDHRPPFRSLVPLRELLSFSLSVGPATKTVGRHYKALVEEFGGELNVLTRASLDDLERTSGPRLAQAVLAVREGRVDVDPGYDGVYGTVTPRTG